MNTMKSGWIVEFLDRQKITSAIVLEDKGQRLKVLTEGNRELNVSAGRLSHASGSPRLDITIGRDSLVEILKQRVEKRNELASLVDVFELWETLNEENQWFSLETMTGLCFPNEQGGDQESAVIRALFKDRLYFKFKPERFFPNSLEQVEKISALIEGNEQREKLVDEGRRWLKTVLSNGASPSNEICQPEIIEILKDYYIFGKESGRYQMARSIVSAAGTDGESGIFKALVKAGVWDENVNLDFVRFNVPVDFPASLTDKALKSASQQGSLEKDLNRIDLTGLDTMTIDGQSTLDYDDAISLEDKGDYYLLGIHIADVAYYVKPGDPIDREALHRGSSIYTPDKKVPMLPKSFAEDICSLKKGRLKPCISTMVRIDKACNIIDWEVMASTIIVKRQLSYYDVNLSADTDPEVGVLCSIAEKFRTWRLNHQALQITLPEINVWINDKNEISVNRINRESPGRLLVSEIMIMANWIMGTFLVENRLPAVFRAQLEPKQRLYKGMDGSLFQNWMQRKRLSRFMLNSKAQPHSGLGLDVYVTATSPIRKYYDLLTQRQLRAALGCEEPLAAEEVDIIMQKLQEPMRTVSKIQFNRQRYWILKHLEGRRGEREEAIVMDHRKNNCTVLLPNYMIECPLPFSSGMTVNQEEMIRVTLQHIDARKNVFAVYMS